MERKIKYQYTYFLYPFEIPLSQYRNYLVKLMKDKKCTMKLFQKEKDIHLYTYFLPEVRNYLFPSFTLEKERMKKLEEWNKDVKLKATMLSKWPCVMFEYNMGSNTQGKIGTKDGLFFRIEKAEIICFHTGTCFFVLKTQLEESTQLSETLDFNYKFRELYSEKSEMKEYENIKIQTDTFNDMKELVEIIEEITGEKTKKKEKKKKQRFFTYSYVCLDAADWGGNTNFEELENEFLKYTYVLPSSYNSNINPQIENNNIRILEKSKYQKYGMTKTSCNLITSSMETDNYTKLPFSYENEYFYTVLLALYQKISLKKIGEGIQKEAIRKYFTENIWTEEVTADETGNMLYQNEKEILELTTLYEEAKQKLDVLYESMGIEKNKKTNRILIVILAISLLLNIVNLIFLLAMY